jgi:hypothetical protein
MLGEEYKYKEYKYCSSHSTPLSPLPTSSSFYPYIIIRTQVHPGIL